MVAVPSEPFHPSYASIEQLRQVLESGRLTSEELVRFYLDRVRRFDKNGPRINAIISLNPNALDHARMSDDRRRTAKTAGKLDGIPFVAKDNLDTVGVPTTGGSAALHASKPAANAFVVQKLLDAGAILLGKANMSELAASCGRFGYSSAGGQTVNPFNPTRHVSGSSSGSAAAVAAGFAPFALGTDTSGSIRAPASAAGLVGLRPTFGLTSRSGVIPMSPATDTTGVLARTVRDLAIVLDVIAHPDPGDAATRDRNRPTGVYTDMLHSPSLDGARLGVIVNFRGLDPEVDAVERTTLRLMRSVGAVLVPWRLPSAYEALWQSVLEPLGKAEFKTHLNRYLSGLPLSQPRSLKQLIEISMSPSIAGSATPVHPGRLRALQDADASVIEHSVRDAAMLTEIIPDLQKGLRRAMSALGLDAAVFTTVGSPATPADAGPEMTLGGAADPYKAGYIASAVGFPEITVPVGRVSGNIPVGYSFLGLPGSEGRLLAFAHALQTQGPELPPPPNLNDSLLRS